MTPPIHSRELPAKSETALYTPEPAKIEQGLWAAADDDCRVYAIVDGAWCHGLYGRLLASGLRWCNLFQGETVLSSTQNAPYLVALERSHWFTQFLLKEVWGQGWGIFLVASPHRARELYQSPNQALLGSLRERGQFIASPGLEDSNDDLLLLRRHFRRFLEVEFEDDGRIVMFRFYDPAVLGTFLLSCNPMELATFFGPVKHYYAEGYSSVASFNQPHMLSRYACVPRNGIPDLQFRQLNMQTGQVTDLFRTEEAQTAYRGSAERQSGPHLMIRSSQAAVFSEVEKKNFLMRVREDISALAAKRGMLVPDPGTMLEWVSETVAAGRSWGLTLQNDLFHFVVCNAFSHDVLWKTPGADALQVMDRSQAGVVGVFVTRRATALLTEMEG